MSNENKGGWFSRILGFVFRNPLNILLFLGLGYCAFQAFVLQNAPVLHKAAMGGIVFIWLFLFVAKNLFRIVLLLLIAAAVFYGFYYVAGHNRRACEENGGFWNANTQQCETKLSWTERLGKMLKWE